MLRQLLIELKREWTLYLRYPADTITGLLVLTATFYALLVGSVFIAGPTAETGGRVDSVILGYWLWSIALFAVNTTATAVREESTAGTLEQLLTVPMSPLRVLMGRAAASFGLNLLNSVFLLGLLLLLTGRRMSFSPVLLIPVATAALAGYGGGLLLAGWALVHKNIGHIQNVFQFMLLFAVMVPVETFGPGWLFLPIAPSAAILRAGMAMGQAPNLPDLAMAALNGVSYLLLGAAGFSWADVSARRRGVLAHY
jgi:ABC-2 type transport system permease protein